MTTLSPDAPRLVAFSTIGDEPWEAGSDAGALLDRARELASFGIDLVRFIEILACGAEAGRRAG